MRIGIFPMIKPTITARATARAFTTRSLTVTRQYSKFSMEQMPGPPKLPKEQQEEFERLQKIANSQAAIDDYNRKISGNGVSENVDHGQDPKTDIGGFSTSFLKTIPEFEGDVNPKTGEKGGPKQDPLRHNDWSFNGRVTDF